MNSLIERVKSAMVGLGTGWILALMLLLSIISLAVMLERVWLYWSLRDDIDVLMRDLGRLLRGGDMDGARRRLEESRSAEAAVVVAGLVEADRGVAAAEEAMEGASCLQRVKLEKRLAFLGTLGNNAPFIGLLGTVIGIVAAFDELSKVKSAAAGAATQLAPEAVMARISEALVATAIGILIAIPAVAAFNAFQRVVRGTVANTEALGHMLLAHLKAVPVAGGGGGRRPGGRSDGRIDACQGRRHGAQLMAGGASSEADDAITGINVTPLVDITLVLLIIFMVTTKIVLNQTVPLDLPKAATGTSDVQTVFSILLAADGRTVVDSQPDRERRGDPSAGAHRPGAAPRAARRHQGRRRGDSRSRHPRARSAQAGARLEDRVRRDARPGGPATLTREALFDAGRKRPTDAEERRSKRRRSAGSPWPMAPRR